MKQRLPVIGMVVALVAGLGVGLLVLRSDAPPDLTQGELDAARQLWQERGPSDYELVIQMGGALQDRRRIEVRGGQVVEMTIDERPAAESSWQYWSVEGMFDFLQTELRNAADPPASLGVADSSQIVLRARFDPQLGYPDHFFRHLLGRQQGTEWDVVSFSPR